MRGSIIEREHFEEDRKLFSVSIVFIFTAIILQSFRPWDSIWGNSYFFPQYTLICNSNSYHEFYLTFSKPTSTSKLQWLWCTSFSTYTRTFPRGMVPRAVISYRSVSDWPCLETTSFPNNGSKRYSILFRSLNCLIVGKASMMRTMMMMMIWC